MSATLRVVLVAPLPPPAGGICKWTEVVLRELGRRPDTEVTVVDITPRWRTVHQLESWRRVLGGGLQLFRDVWRTWRTIRRHRPQVLHLCTSGQVGTIRDIVVFAIAKLHRVKTTYHFHFGRIPELARTGGTEWGLIRRALAMADVALVLDAASAVTLRAFCPAYRVVQMPNCLSAAEFVGGKTSEGISADRRPGVRRMTFIGHVKGAKGVGELVLAGQRLAGEMTVEVEIIGPPDERYVRDFLAEAGSFATSVLVRGELSHAQSMESLRRSDLLALPSYTEGFPYVVLEAMALGKPVVATDVGAIADMIEAGTDRAAGLVVPPRDVAALAAALRTVLCDPDEAALMGRRGRRRFEGHFTSEVVVDRLCALWAQLAASTLPRRKDSAKAL